MREREREHGGRCGQRAKEGTCPAYSENSKEGTSESEASLGEGKAGGTKEEECEAFRPCKDVFALVVKRS